MYKIDDKVKIISDNENYIEFLDKVLNVVFIARNETEHQGYDSSMNGMQLMEFTTENGEDVPFALYEYEIEHV